MILRKPLMRFAQLQEKVLQDNDHKGGWEEMKLWDLIECLEEEVDELKESLIGEDMQKECADVSNFAMMIFDLVRRILNGTAPIPEKRCPFCNQKPS